MPIEPADPLADSTRYRYFSICSGRLDHIRDWPLEAITTKRAGSEILLTYACEPILAPTMSPNLRALRRPQPVKDRDEPHEFADLTDTIDDRDRCVEAESQHDECEARNAED